MLQNIVPTSNITTPRARHSLQSDISAEFGSLSFSSSQWFFFFFLKKILDFQNLFIFGCAGSSLLHRLFYGCGEWGQLSSFSDRASHCRGFSWLWIPGSRASRLQ